ncbi:ATP-binding protein [Delftia sp. GW456-R20]|uniref:ATP-binding protein n=1 Tax=Delftia sp. GW456-R20 TaxID=1827145 RepID=UPI0009ED9387|nr:ATP-binding protein [Delftia sp. GW456-R20]
MQQIDATIIESLSSETAPGKVVFLIGENGAGKSRILSSLAEELYGRKKENIIAISNSPYTRFHPTSYYRSQRYNRHLSGVRDISPSKLIKNVIASIGQGEKPRWNNQRRIEQLLKTLDYLGISPIIGFSIDVKNFIADSYHFNSEQVDDYATRPKFMERFLQDRVEKAKNVLHFEFDDDVAVALGYLDRISESSRKIEWVDLRDFYRQRNFEVLRALCASEYKFSNFLKVNIYAQKNNKHDIFFMDGISSGEKSHFSIINFISSKIAEDTWILIDEPENSLHPRWQRNYCSILLDNFHYFQPKIVIATHSPMIVSGASSAGVSDMAYHPGSHRSVSIDGVESVESILMEVFDTITPKNHHLSVQAQELLEDLSSNRIDLSATLATIKEWSSKITEDKQRAFLDGLEELAKKISTEPF